MNELSDVKVYLPMPERGFLFFPESDSFQDGSFPGDNVNSEAAGLPKEFHVSGPSNRVDTAVTAHSGL